MKVKYLIYLASELSGDSNSLLTMVLDAEEEEFDSDTDEKAEENARIFDKAGLSRLGT